MLKRGESLNALYKSELEFTPPMLAWPSVDNKFLELENERIAHLKSRKEVIDSIKEAIKGNNDKYLASDRWSITTASSMILADRNANQMISDIIEDDKSRQLYERVQQLLPPIQVSATKQVEAPGEINRSKEQADHAQSASPFDPSSAKKLIEDRHKKAFQVHIECPTDKDISYEGCPSEEPVSKCWKEKKILKIDTLNKPSKVGFIQHDVLDHAKCFYVLKGLITGTHQELFRALNMPISLETKEGGLFSREGELVAAISYAFRQYLFYSQQPNSRRQICELGFEAFINVIEQLHDVGLAQELQVKIEDLISKDQNAWKLLSHVICNCILEVEELQRQYGFPRLEIKVQSSSRKVILDPWNPLYISFVVDAVSLLMQHPSKLPHLVSLKLEGELRRFIDQQKGKSFKVSASCLMTNRYSKKAIPEDIQDYIKQSPHFSAS